jgi:UDP-N-acetylmuramoyl-tripeptide--D-alanyl-D-alanine ligase
MREWNADRVALAAGARVVCGFSSAGPTRVSIDSRDVRAGDLFVGLSGEHADGGEYAAQALQAGAWGVLVAPEHVDAAAATAAAMGATALAAATATSAVAASASATDGTGCEEAVVLAHEDPLEGLQELARSWRSELQAAGAKVVGVTGSTGKTSTKDILTSLLVDARVCVQASSENQNTEIGLPLTILAAPAGTQMLVLEMAMRGQGQIAELAEIAQPDVGVIVNIGPVHLQQLGSVEGVAAAKAELIAGLKPGATAIVPVDEPLLEPYWRSDLRMVTFGGSGGDFQLAERAADGRVVIVDRTSTPPEEIVLKPSFEQEHNLRNLAAAVAAARALGVTPAGEVRVAFSKMRGERRELPEGAVLIEDCYNANPMSMRAAIDDLVATAPTRKVAVLGDMLELGPAEDHYHREIGEYAAEHGVDILVTVGPRAVEMARAFRGPGETHSAPDAQIAGELLGELLEPKDTVLVKGSRGMGLERVAEVLAAPSATSDTAPTSAADPSDSAADHPSALTQPAER